MGEVEALVTILDLSKDWSFLAIPVTAMAVGSSIEGTRNLKNKGGER